MQLVKFSIGSEFGILTIYAGRHGTKMSMLSKWTPCIEKCTLLDISKLGKRAYVYIL